MPKNSQCKRRVFISGAGGFIGKHFLKCTLSNATDVENGFTARALCWRKDDFTDFADKCDDLQILQKSLADLEQKDFDDCEVFVHLASAGVDPRAADDWETCFQTNLIDSLRAWRLAHAAGVAHLIIVGSCSEYGQSGEACEFVSPSAELLPLNAYGASKAAASLAAIALAGSLKWRVSVLRLFHVYGAGEADWRLHPSLLRAARSGEDLKMTAGEQVRDFCSAEKVAQQIFSEFASTKKFPRDKHVRIRNIGSGTVRTVADFAREIWRQEGASGKLLLGALPYRKNESMRYVPDTKTEILL